MLRTIADRYPSWKELCNEGKTSSVASCAITNDSRGRFRIWKRKQLIRSYSVFLPGLGGPAYGSGETDIYGKARISISVMDNRTDRSLWEKAYFSRIEERMTRLKTDSHEEKSRLIGKALKRVMEAIKEDLHQYVE